MWWITVYRGECQCCCDQPAVPRLYPPLCVGADSRLWKFPTRLGATLDLFMTNRPSLVDKCRPAPGVGDHDIVYVTSSASVRRPKPVQHKIYLWNKADLDTMKGECCSITTKFLEDFTTSSVASVRRPSTLISILTFVSCVRGLLSPASLNMRARATLRGVVLLLRISAFKKVRALIDISKSPDECYIYSVMLYFLLSMSYKR